MIKKRRAAGKNSAADVKRALVFFDPHHPYSDKKAYDLMLKVAADVGVDEVVVGGDFSDFYNVTSHDKDSRIKVDFEEELSICNDELDRLEKLFPKAKWVFIEGNHETRLSRYLNKKAPEISGLMGISKLFRFKERGWHFVPYAPGQKYSVLGSKLWARHEPLGGGTEHPASGTVHKAGASVIFGHVHRIQEHQDVTLGGSNHRAFTCGWLGDQDALVMQYVKSHHQWALGFCIVTALPDGKFFAQTVHIIDYTCMYGGKIYSVK